MSRPAVSNQGYAPGYAYHLLRAALDTYQRNPGQLQAGELDRVRRKADQALGIESLVLGAAEARGVWVSPDEVERAVAAVAARYGSREELLNDLRCNDLDEAALRTALQRELLFDTVMERVGARRAAVSDIDIRLFYEVHRDRFRVAEQRMARHLLITVNPDYPENTPAAGLARMRDIAARLADRPSRFASLARRYSECPSALQGGKLGAVVRGQLYPELDAALFALHEGAVSDVVETALGFHLLWCERIEPGRQVALAKARDGIRQLLEQRQRRNCQKAWLAELRRAAAPEP